MARMIEETNTYKDLMGNLKRCCLEYLGVDGTIKTIKIK